MRMDVSPCSAVLAKDFEAAEWSTYFLQVNVKIENGKLMAYPDPGGGSGDFANLKNVINRNSLATRRSLFVLWQAQSCPTSHLEVMSYEVGVMGRCAGAGVICPIMATINSAARRVNTPCPCLALNR